MDIEWKVTTVPEELAAQRLARLLARLILDAEDTLSEAAPPTGCVRSRDDDRNEEIPSTQVVPS